MARIDGRAPDELRKIVITPDYLSHPLASVLIRNGGTRVVCAVSIDAKVPAWMKNRKVPGGWITCEYGMLPASTHDRMKRESSAGKQGGRTVEIQRLIGRSLRMSADLLKLGENTAYLDCDVIDADGGTRCAGITGAATALAIACRRGVAKGIFPENPFKESVAAISVGVIGGVPMLDLCYEEDSNAEVDMNVVMTESGKLVEVQGTAEGEPFSRARLNELIDLAEHGLKQVFAMQREAVETALEVRP
ncbi:ribonuclease PH [Victivallis vadensis]|uniref:Ribonuclease PH n=1 Tax=Victivallis vadensis TaxID=172901 RepID=A0A2U1BA07_9BACT|nr:ribonuclease PH [Victivallis vadensis]NMD87888.1 ribonuclease PH [Victivallis vadensis]PVY45461.1 RNAse PH [Victivallis vadensis]PWM78487.1 MAG: ribonuclease PH [Lentisphaerota bacterium]HJH05227.1 ribonuclease PH [Victivallis vadensis]